MNRPSPSNTTGPRARTRSQTAPMRTRSQTGTRSRGTATGGVQKTAAKKGKQKTSVKKGTPATPIVNRARAGASSPVTGTPGGARTARTPNNVAGPSQPRKTGSPVHPSGIPRPQVARVVIAPEPSQTTSFYSARSLASRNNNANQNTAGSLPQTVPISQRTRGIPSGSVRAATGRGSAPTNSRGRSKYRKKHRRLRKQQEKENMERLRQNLREQAVQQQFLQQNLRTQALQQRLNRERGWGWKKTLGLGTLLLAPHAIGTMYMRNQKHAKTMNPPYSPNRGRTREGLTITQLNRQLKKRYSNYVDPVHFGV